MIQFNFVPNRRIWYTISGTLCLTSIILIFMLGLNLGLDFKGGTLIEVAFQSKVPTITQLQEQIKSFETAAKTTTAEDPAAQPATQKVELKSLLIQPSGTNNFIIRTDYMDQETHTAILERMTALNDNQPVTEVRYETIGPTVSETLKQRAVVSISLVSICIILYIGFAFRKMPKGMSSLRFGVAAVLALMHDVLIATGAYVLFSYFKGAEVDTMFITALLTIMSFSVHDTIVVFDRIRENVLKSQGRKPLAELANDSVNQTVSRSFNTSMTTLITLFALLIFGEKSIQFFAATLVVGMVVGTYSSIFLATPIVVDWHKGMKAEGR